MTEFKASLGCIPRGVCVGGVERKLVEDFESRNNSF